MNPSVWSGFLFVFCVLVSFRADAKTVWPLSAKRRVGFFLISLLPVLAALAIAAAPSAGWRRRSGKLLPHVCAWMTGAALTGSYVYAILYCYRGVIL